MKRILVAVAAAALLVGLAPIARASDDPDWQLQWAPAAIHAPEAWTVARGKGVTIAVVDSGVERDHADLKDKLVQGYDIASDDNDPTDTNGHGTHVSGIAAASTDNGIGVAGIAPDARIMPIRWYDPDESNTVKLQTDLVQAIRYAVDHGAKVINLSVEEGGVSGDVQQLRPQMTTACTDAFNRGSLCVIAAGNAGQGKPSGYDHDLNGIVVAASNRSGQVTDFSQNADTKWAVTAPGASIYSTWLDNTYRYLDGTSMATPQVSGVAALLFSQGKSIQQVVDRILSTATPMNDGGAQSGAGLVNAAAAVGAPYQSASTPGTPLPSATPTTQPSSATGGSRPSVSAPAGGPTTTATLVEGNVDNGAGDFSGGSGSDFENALGKDVKGPKPISTSGGVTLPFAGAIAAFVAVLGVLGFFARRVVIRRGIGAAKPH